MNRKLLYAKLVLVNLLPFIYGFAKGYSFRAPFVNLIAFVSGQEYNARLIILMLLALLLSGVLVITLASPNTSSNTKKHLILHPSDGRQIAEENRFKVLQLQQLLQEAEQEQPSKAKQLPVDAGLDMNIL